MVLFVSQLDGSADLTEQDKSNIRELALSWDLPGVTQSNRKWLHERLLFHAVSNNKALPKNCKHYKNILKILKFIIFLSNYFSVLVRKSERVFCHCKYSLNRDILNCQFSFTVSISKALFSTPPAWSPA